MNNRACLLRTGVDLEIPEAFKPASLLIGYESEELPKMGAGYGYVSSAGVGALNPTNGAVAVYAGKFTNGSFCFTCTFDVGEGNSGVMIYKNERYTSILTPSEQAERLYEDWKSLVGKRVEVLLARASDLGGHKLLPLHACNSLWRVAA